MLRVYTVMPKAMLAVATTVAVLVVLAAAVRIFEVGLLVDLFMHACRRVVLVVVLSVNRSLT